MLLTSSPKLKEVSYHQERLLKEELEKTKKLLPSKDKSDKALKIKRGGRLI